MHKYLEYMAQNLVRLCMDQGIKIKIYCTNRTIEEQDELYAQGRTLPGDIITYAKGGQSYHNYGLAFDCCPIVDNKAAWDRIDLFKKMGEIGKSIGLVWGGDFTSLVDMPHFQWTDGLTWMELKEGAKPIMTDIKEFQAKYGVPITGVLDETTKNKANELIDDAQNVFNANIIIDNVKPTIYEKIGITNIAWIDPRNIFAKAVQKNANDFIGNYKSFINGQYHWWNNNKCNIIGWQYSNGLPTHENVILSDYEFMDEEKKIPRRKGTFIVYKDYSMEVKNMSNSELNTIKNDIWFCVQGFNLNPLDLSAEKYSNADIANITRATQRHIMIINEEKHMIGICCRPASTAQRGQDTMFNLKCKKGIGTDCGTISTVKMDGNVIINTNQYLSNIIFWN